MSYNARREKSTFKKRESQKQQLGKTGRGEERGKRRDDRSGTESRSKGAEGLKTGLRSADATRRPAR